MFLVLYSLFFTFPLHSFHVSVTELNYDKSEKRIEITQRIFLDDLEMAIRTTDGDFLVDDPKEKVDASLSQYLPRQMGFNINGKSRNLTYLGYKLEEDVLVAFYQISDIRKLKSLHMDIELLLESLSDQVNIVHFTNGTEAVKSYKFDGTKKKHSLID